MRRLGAVAAVMLLAACGSESPPEPGPRSPATSDVPRPTGPAAAVAGLMRALDAGDCRAARRLVLSPSELGCDVVEQSAGSFADEGIDLDDVTYRNGAVHDASTTVTIRWGEGYPPESYDVQRVGGRWKVVFDSAA